jgi:hypothetical protein
MRAINRLTEGRLKLQRAITVCMLSYSVGIGWTSAKVCDGHETVTEGHPLHLCYWVTDAISVQIIEH